jgi:hypothetical protein
MATEALMAKQRDEARQAYLVSARSQWGDVMRAVRDLEEVDRWVRTLLNNRDGGSAEPLDHRFREAQPIIDRAKEAIDELVAYGRPS